jgi:hypothetical protein
MSDRPEVAGLDSGSALGKCRAIQQASIFHTTLRPYSHIIPLLNILAGLHTVTLQQLGPDTAPSTLEALATLEHLRSLDTP